MRHYKDCVGWHGVLLVALALCALGAVFFVQLRDLPQSSQHDIQQSVSKQNGSRISVVSATNMTFEPTTATKGGKGTTTNGQSGLLGRASVGGLPYYEEGVRTGERSYKPTAATLHTNYLAKLRDLHSLGDTLSPDKVRELLDFLNVRWNSQTDLSAAGLAALKNDVLDKLLRQKQLPEGLGLYIVDMYRDRSHDAIWRDYCVQHFSLCYDARWPSGTAPTDDPEARSIRSACWEAVSETDSTIAGTALLALERLSRQDSSFDRERVQNLAVSYALNGSCPEKTRITALQVCVSTGRSDVLPDARRLASENSSVPLRMSAIAAVGAFGGEPDIEFLKALGDSPSNEYVRKAANAAAKRVKDRLGIVGVR